MTSKNGSKKGFFFYLTFYVRFFKVIVTLKSFVMADHPANLVMLNFVSLPTFRFIRAFSGPSMSSKQCCNQVCSRFLHPPWHWFPCAGCQRTLCRVCFLGLVYENDLFPEYCDDCKEELREGSDSESGDVIFAESDPESESLPDCSLEPVVGVLVLQ